MSGIYVAGWIKRGPTGVIASNVFDGQETADTILRQWEQIESSKSEKTGDIVSLLQERRVPYINWDGWLAIKAAEEKNGAKLGKISEKFVEIVEMLNIANSANEE